MDTNNPEELLVGINKTQLEEIIDHRKLVGGLITLKPTAITIQPFACTVIILWEKMKIDGNWCK